MWKKSKLANFQQYNPFNYPDPIKTIESATKIVTDDK